MTNDEIFQFWHICNAIWYNEHYNQLKNCIFSWQREVTKSNQTMASSLPIPRPPRTPTPPTPLDYPNRGVLGDPQNVHDGFIYDPNALSPPFPPNRFGSMPSPTSAGGFSSPTLSTDGMMSLPPPKGPANPFNFQTQTIKDAPIIKSVCNCPEILTGDVS